MKTYELPYSLSSENKLGLVAPAGKLIKKNLKAGLKILRKLGYKDLILPGKVSNHRYFAGTDNSRIKKFNKLINHPKVKSIFCLRGGYGSSRIVSRLDLKKMIKKKILFCGYSDITVFHMATFKLGGLITFYGPMPGIDFSSKKIEKIKKALSRLENFDRKNWTYKIRGNGLNLKKKITGRSVAGCLTILQSLIGTPYQPDLKNCILFLEDINEEPYKVERMLIHLNDSGILKGVKGILFSMKGPGERSLKLKHSLKDIEKISGIPVLTGFPFGHKQPFNIIPIGAPVEITSNAISFFGVRL